MLSHLPLINYKLAIFFVFIKEIYSKIKNSKMFSFLIWAVVCNLVGKRALGHRVLSCPLSIITAFLSLFCATLLLSLIASQTSIKIELLWHAKSVKNTLSQPFLLFCVCMVTRNKQLLRAHFWKVKDFHVSKFFFQCYSWEDFE